MRIFKSRSFARFAHKEHISDSNLRAVVRDVEAGKVDADYGGGVIKQRIARAGGGKSGGYRAVILYHRGQKAFFVYGYAKKDQDNISAGDARNFKDAAREVLAFSEAGLDQMVRRGAFEEVRENDP